VIHSGAVESIMLADDQRPDLGVEIAVARISEGVAP